MDDQQTKAAAELDEFVGKLESVERLLNADHAASVASAVAKMDGCSFVQTSAPIQNRVAPLVLRVEGTLTTALTLAEGESKIAVVEGGVPPFSVGVINAPATLTATSSTAGGAYVITIKANDVAADTNERIVVVDSSTSRTSVLLPVTIKNK